MIMYSVNNPQTSTWGIVWSSPYYYDWSRIMVRVVIVLDQPLADWLTHPPEVPGAMEFPAMEFPVTNWRHMPSGACACSSRWQDGIFPFLLNPKMDMRGPRGPQTTSNVFSTLTISRPTKIIGFYLKLRFLQNVLWGPRGPQNHLV